MKKLILTLCICVFVFSAKAQITLTQDNMPLPSYSASYPEIVAGLGPIAAPAPGANQTWDYSGLTDSANVGISVVKNTEPYFPATCLEDTELFPLSDYASIYASAIFGQDSKGFFIPGYTINDQIYALNTGGNYDNVTVPPQGVVFEKPQTLVPYPTTFQTKWTNSYTVSYNFLMTVDADQLYNEFVIKVAHFTEYDSIAGWGNLIIPSPNHASAPIPALMVRQKTIEQDSFYVQNYQEPSPTVLGLMGLYHNGQTTTRYSERFLGENRLFYLLKMDFGSDQSYSNVQNAMYSAHDITSGLKPANGNSIGFSVYPNPVSQNTVHCVFDKRTNKNWTATITNMLGQKVLDKEISGSGKIDTPLYISGLAHGLYLVNITDENGCIQSSSKIEIK